MVSSFGSFLSVFSSLFFFYVIYDMLMTQYLIKKNNPWKHYKSDLEMFIIPSKITKNFLFFLGIITPSTINFDAPEK